MNTITIHVCVCFPCISVIIVHCMIALFHSFQICDVLQKFPFFALFFLANKIAMVEPRAILKNLRYWVTKYEPLSALMFSTFLKY